MFLDFLLLIPMGIKTCEFTRCGLQLIVYSCVLGCDRKSLCPTGGPEYEGSLCYKEGENF